jgi:hypothetical protein
MRKTSIHRSLLILPVLEVCGVCRKPESARARATHDFERNKVLPEKYGTRPNALNEKAEAPRGGEKEPNGDYNHTVWIKDLKPNTTY